MYAIFGSAATGRTNLKAKSVESGNYSNILEQLSKEKVPSFNLEVLSFWSLVLFITLSYSSKLPAIPSGRQQERKIVLTLHRI